MTTIQGHLTATEKRHIRHMIDRNMYAGKIGRKNYNIIRIEIDTPTYAVMITENSTQWCETRPRVVTNKHIIQL